MIRGLCSRCGAVRPDPPDDATEGACPECGLGFSVGRVLFSEEGPADPAALDATRARMAERRRAAVDAWDGVAYGLDRTWRGRRWIGGWGGGSPGGRRHLELAHGDVWVEGAPVVRISTHRGHRLAWEAQGLVHHHFHDTGVQTDAMRATFTGSDPLEAWDTLTIEVDEVPTAFRALGDAAHAIALAEIGDLAVTITSRDIAIDAVRLVSIVDLAAYLADDGAPAR